MSTYGAHYPAAEITDGVFNIDDMPRQVVGPAALSAVVTQTNLDLLGELTVNGLTTLGGGFTTTASNGQIGGQLSVAGLSTLLGGATTNDTSTASNRLMNRGTCDTLYYPLAGGSSLPATTFTGAVTCNSTIAVTGASTLSGGVAISNGATLTGGTTAGNQIINKSTCDTLYYPLAGGPSLPATTFTGAVACNSTLAVTGNTTLGSSTVINSLTVSTNQGVSGNFYVTGSTNCAGVANLSGGAVITNGATLTGGTTAGDQIINKSTCDTLYYPLAGGTSLPATTFTGIATCNLGAKSLVDPSGPTDLVPLLYLATNYFSKTWLSFTPIFTLVTGDATPNPPPFAGNGYYRLSGGGLCEYYVTGILSLTASTDVTPSTIRISLPFSCASTSPPSTILAQTPQFFTASYVPVYLWPKPTTNYGWVAATQDHDVGTPVNLGVYGLNPLVVPITYSGIYST